MYHCSAYSVWSGPILIVLYLALSAKSLDTPELQVTTGFDRDLSCPLFLHLKLQLNSRRLHHGVLLLHNIPCIDDYMFLLHNIPHIDDSKYICGVSTEDLHGNTHTYIALIPRNCQWPKAACTG